MMLYKLPPQEFDEILYWPNLLLPVYLIEWPGI